MAGLVEVIRVYPGARSLAAVLQSKSNRLECIVTAFDPVRLRLARDLLQNHPTAEFCELGRVCSRFLTLLGGTPRSLPGRNLIEAMAQRSMSRLPEDTPYQKAAPFPGAQRACAEALQTLRSWGLDSGELRDLAQAHPEESWLCHLAQICQDMEFGLDTLGRQFNSAVMKECLQEEPIFRQPAGVIVLAGSEPAPLEADWLDWLAAGGIEVTVLVDTAEEARMGAFAGSDWWQERFGRAKRVGAPSAMAASLFAEGKADSGPTLRIVQAPDRLAECEWAIRAALQRQSEGTPLSRIGIWFRRADEYGSLLAAAARRLGVPLDDHRRVPMRGSAFARFVQDALVAIASPDGWPLLRLASSSFIGATGESRTELKAALSQAQADDRPWEFLATWAEEREDEFAWLVGISAWRREVAGREMSLAEWRTTWESFGAQEWLVQAVDRAKQREREVHAQSAMLRSLAAQASVRKLDGDPPISLRGFMGCVTAAVQNQDVHWSGVEGGIQVMSSPHGFGELDFLYCLGMLEGTIPSRRTEHPILNDRRLAFLSGLLPERPPFPNSHDRSHAERDLLYTLASLPSQELAVCCPAFTEERGEIPTAYIEVLRRAASEAAEERLLRSQPLPETPISEADKRLAAARTLPALSYPEAVLKEPSVKARLRSASLLRMTPEGISDARTCPFHFFARHCFRIPTYGSRALFAHLVDIPRRADLATVHDLEDGERRMEAALREISRELAAEYEPGQIRLFDAAGRRTIREAVSREQAARQEWRPSFEVLDSPQFGNPCLSDSLRLKDEETGIKLKGGANAMLVSGQTTFAVLYESVSPWDPTGAPPPPGQDDYALAPLREDAASRIGLFLTLMRAKGVENPAVEIDPLHGGQRLLVVFSPEGHNPFAKLQTRDTRVIPFGKSDFAKIRRRLHEAVAAALETIRKPETQPRPTDSACKFCEFGELCRKHADFGENLFP